MHPSPLRMDGRRDTPAGAEYHITLGGPRRGLPAATILGAGRGPVRIEFNGVRTIGYL